jgi:hypothetical protein
VLVERKKAQMRARVEHPFHIVKNLFRYKKVRWQIDYKIGDRIEWVRTPYQWGNVMNGAGASTILEVKLLSSQAKPSQAKPSQAKQLMRLERLDGIGPAVYGELEQLRGAVIKALGK